VRSPLLLLAAAFLFAGCATGDGNLMRELDLLMRDYQGNVPGASVLVTRDGVPVVQRSWGLANLEEGIAATPSTNYRLASLTKQFTAAATLLLVEDGRLRLEDRARDWLPSLPEATSAVTIRHLLTHTSGIVAYEDLIPSSTTTQLRDADVLGLLEAENRTYFEPGTSYRYSNSGYALLALIIERASGKGFARFLKERIFEPLGMDGSVAFEDGVTVVHDRAFGYSRSATGWTRDDHSITSAVLGDGGIYTSITDLARWDAALYDERLLSTESLRLAFAASTPTDDPDVAYGFGWRLTGETMWHSGETRGFRNAILRVPERGLAVVVLTNRNEGRPRDLTRSIAGLF
jgi:CubicO group peptidase (beta-lactamase class C family)